MLLEIAYANMLNYSVMLLEVAYFKQHDTIVKQPDNLAGCVIELFGLPAHFISNFKQHDVIAG